MQRGDAHVPSSAQREEDDIIPPIRGADGSWIKAIQLGRVRPSTLRRSVSTAMKTSLATLIPSAPRAGSSVTATPLRPGIAPHVNAGSPPADQMSGGWRRVFTFSEGLGICVSATLALFEDKALITTLVRSSQFHDTGVAITTRCNVIAQHQRSRR